MRSKTKIAAWVFVVIPVATMVAAYTDPYPKAAAAALFPSVSAVHWLMAALWREWRWNLALPGTIYCGMSVLMFLVAYWHPFGVSWAILIPAWLVLVGIELLVIRAENRAQPAEES